MAHYTDWLPTTRDAQLSMASVTAGENPEDLHRI
jgi:hypothetical protein